MSADKKGIVEYWSGPKGDYGFPKNVSWEYKTDTDLFEFMKVRKVLFFISVLIDYMLP